MPWPCKHLGQGLCQGLAKSLDKALKEVVRRGLDKFDKFEDNEKGKKVSSPKAKQAA